MTTRISRSRKLAAILAVAAVGGAVSWSGLAGASGAGSHGLHPAVETNVVVEEPIKIRTRGESRVIVTHIGIDPAGHTAWHYHPGPHIVSVRTGAVLVYERDCSVRRYEAGSGFFDPGSTKRLHIHTLRNASDDAPAEVVITDIREHGLPPTNVVSQQPAPCFT